MIYFITAREIGRVKIGYSQEPRTRFMKMRTDSPVPLALERICEGGVSVEHALHDRFAAHRLQGEWFALSHEIERHMETLTSVDRAPKGKSLTSTIAEGVGISRSYASMIATGSRNPSRPLAIHILRTTGWRHEILADLTDDQISTLEQIEPWTPRQRCAA